MHEVINVTEPTVTEPKISTVQVMNVQLNAEKCFSALVEKF